MLIFAYRNELHVYRSYLARMIRVIKRPCSSSYAHFRTNEKEKNDDAGDSEARSNVLLELRGSLSGISAKAHH